MKTRKFQLPDFLERFTSYVVYERWLARKAAAHVKRDRKRGNAAAGNSVYKIAIHEAVCRSDGRDAYTGEMLDWSLISTYNNDESQANRRRYKAGFALLPTVDHLNDGLGPADFAICGWRTNAAKSDMSYGEFVALCRRVVAQAGSDAAGLLSAEEVNTPPISAAAH